MDTKQIQVAHRSKYRFIILLLACFSIFCDYFINDIPALLKQGIVERFSKTEGKENAEIYYSFLYSFYSIPNIILPLFGGILSDELGYRTMTIIFLLFITLGQFVVCAGMFAESIWLTIFGRFIFGLGGESLNISLQTLIVAWFNGSELTFAQSIELSLVRVASVLNTYLTPRIAEYQGMNHSFYFGFIICIFSLLCSILLVYLDKYLMIGGEEEQKKEDDRKLTVILQYFKELIHKIMINIKYFSKFFWIMTVLMVLLYVCVITFNTFSSGIIIELWLPKDNSLEKNQEIAGQIMSIPYIMASIIFPMLGLIVDKFGQRVRLLMMSPILILLAFILLPFYYPTSTFILLGISYGIFGAVIWPTVAYIVPKSKLGIGYGIMNAVQNFFMGILPMVIAFIEVHGSVYKVIQIFLLFGVLSLVCIIYFSFLDSKKKVSLNECRQELLMAQVENEEEQKANNYYKEVPQYQANDEEIIADQNINNQTKQNEIGQDQVKKEILI